ncbi:hypothetical protein Sjap_011690 [Stephania japonica]|uniref:Uncharacterized protein n=1 Tax=Stephania japonica TaxID=461633 RepID=A0AAP0JC01_9MAGN
MSSDGIFVQPTIPRFDGHYDHWSMLMENFLRSKEYWTVVVSGVAEPAAGVVLTDAAKSEFEALKLKDLKAKNYLFQAIDRSILETILCKDTAKHIWDSMKKKYQGTTRAKRQLLQTLRSGFEMLRMKSGESVTDYFSRTMAIVNKMRMHGDKTEDVFVVEKILRSLTPKFNFVVCDIEEANDVDLLSIDELQSSLLVHERKLNQQETEEQALKALSAKHFASNSIVRGRGRGSDRGRGRGGSNNNNHGSPQQNSQNKNSQGRGRGRGSCQSTFYRSKLADKSNVECFRCHRYGHYKSECKTDLNGQTGDQTHFAEEEEEEEVSLLMVCHVKEETHHNMWYLDTGCNNHMCGEKGAFSYLDETFRSSVKFGDDSKISVMGKGKVTIQTKENSIHTIANVLFVPDLKTNLLSVGQLQEKGYEIVIKDGVCHIRDAKLGFIAQVNMTKNRMFPLYLHTTTHSCFSTKSEDEAWLWHIRYGHLNFGGLKTLHQRNMVIGLPQIAAPDKVCEDCIVSKQHRLPFTQGKSLRAKKALELVHSDICGPITPYSNGGKRYVITFIDDYSRKIWVYFLQEKSEAFAAFKSFKALVEKEASSPIKVLRTDRGGEYNSHAFADFCAQHGIKRQLTTAYTPQQNGVCERKNRTIMNMVRSLLTTSGIPKNFWPEAVNWSIHILNRSPTLAVSGRKPVVDHFQIFGCIAYAHVPDEKRRKLDNKGEKCIFLGVSGESKAYKLYNPNTKKILVSRDVLFNEKSIWSWNQNCVQGGIPADFDDEEQEQQPMENEQVEEAIPNPPATESQRPQRVWRRPAWTSDYEVTGIDPGDDPLTHFALFSDCDPTSFEMAVKEPKWREAMAVEFLPLKEIIHGSYVIFQKGRRQSVSSGFTRRS